MRDVLGKELRMGQRVVVTSNSTFKVGVLYNYRPNTGKYYLEVVDRVANGNDEIGGWYRRYWTPEKIEAQSHKYYVRFPDGKTRSVDSADRILGIPDEEEKANDEL